MSRLPEELVKLRDLVGPETLKSLRQRNTLAAHRASLESRLSGGVLMEDYTPKSQHVFQIIVMIVLVAALLGATGANIWALIDCAPQAGKWTPWTGKICYGEH